MRLTTSFLVIKKYFEPLVKIVVCYFKREKNRGLLTDREWNDVIIMRLRLSIYSIGFPKTSSAQGHFVNELIFCNLLI